MIEVQVLIPTADNSGTKFTDAHHAHFEAELLGLFGGFSRLPGLVSGGWIDGGTEYRDTTVVYAVFVPGLLVGAALVIAAVAFAKTHYGQLAITARYLDHAEIL